MAARIEARHSEEFSKYLTFSPLDQAQHPQRYVWAWKMGQGADQELKIEAGSVFHLIPGVPHWYAPDPDTGWDEHWVGPEAESVFQQARFRFLENLARPLDIEEFARELNLDYPSCRRLFKDYTGLSPYQYFLQLKIHRARHLLQEGNLSVKEVSYELSFDNQYYFSRIFKKKTGRSPSEWQRRSQP